MVPLNLSRCHGNTEKTVHAVGWDFKREEINQSGRVNGRIANGIQQSEWYVVQRIQLWLVPEVRRCVNILWRRRWNTDSHAREFWASRVAVHLLPYGTHLGVCLLVRVVKSFRVIILVHRCNWPYTLLTTGWYDYIRLSKKGWHVLAQGLFHGIRGVDLSTSQKPTEIIPFYIVIDEPYKTKEIPLRYGSINTTGDIIS